MPNEEPEGPDLPPRKKSAIIEKIERELEIKETSNLKLKGFIGAIAAVIIIVSYILYSYYYYNNGVKLNELYFISSGIGISIFTGLLFTFFKNIHVKTILLFTSIFYLMLEVIYVTVWIIFGHPYAYLKTALIIGLIIGIIYLIYDKLNNKPRTGN